MKILKVCYRFDDESERSHFFAYVRRKGYFVQEDVDGYSDVARIFACDNSPLPTRKVASTFPRGDLNVEDFIFTRVIEEYVSSSASAVDSSTSEKSE